MAEPKLKLVEPNGRRRSGVKTPRTGEAEAPPVHPFDALHGTDTGGLIPGTELATGAAVDRYVTAYYAVAPSILRSLLELWQTRCKPPFALDRYVFVDVGAGKGRGLLVAAENPFREVVGVELNPGLAAIARSNLRAARAAGGAGGAPERLAPVRLVEGDVLRFPLPHSPTLFFLFHPFEAPAVRRLLRHIRQQAAARPLQVDLLYVNAEHADAIERDEQFVQLWSGRVPMSTEDHLADLREIANQQEYGSTGDEVCAVFRFIGRRR